ncbi:MAG: transporter substrate-binding domain-containing protein, partial [Anaerolineales bacterium]|nr:transporter substrate-binding domain-containing protein [Anaerolineales bacterium]
QAAEEGRSAAVLIDAISSGLYLLNHESALSYRGEPIVNEPYALVVRADDELLLEKLNEALARLQASGELDRIIRSHLIVP